MLLGGSQGNPATADLSTGLRAQRKRCCGATGLRGVPRARPPRPADRRGLRGWKRREALEGTHKARVKDGKKRPGKVPVHLFTGLLKCSQCGGKFIVANRSHYMCANRANRRQEVVSRSVV